MIKTIFFNFRKKKKTEDELVKKNNNILKNSKLLFKFIFLLTFLSLPNDCFAVEDLVYYLLAVEPEREETLVQKVLKPYPIDLERAYELYYELVVFSGKKKKKKKIRKLPNFNWKVFYALREKLQLKTFPFKKITDGIFYKVPSYSLVKKQINFLFLRSQLIDILVRLLVSLLYRKLIQKIFLEDTSILDEKKKELFIKICDFLFILFLIFKLFSLIK